MVSMHPDMDVPKGKMPSSSPVKAYLILQFLLTGAGVEEREA